MPPPLVLLLLLLLLLQAPVLLLVLLLLPPRRRAPALVSRREGEGLLPAPGGRGKRVEEEGVRETGRLKHWL